MTFKSPEGIKFFTFCSTSFSFGTGTIVSDSDLEGTDRDAGEQVSRDNPKILSSNSRINRCKEWDHFIPVRDCNGRVQGARCKYCPNVEIQCGGTTGMKGLKTHFRSKKCRSNRPADDQLPNPTR